MGLVIRVSVLCAAGQCGRAGGADPQRAGRATAAGWENIQSKKTSAVSLVMVKHLQIADKMESKFVFLTDLKVDLVCYQMSTNIFFLHKQVHLIKVECRGKVHLFQ